MAGGRGGLEVEGGGEDDVAAHHLGRRQEFFPQLPVANHLRDKRRPLHELTLRETSAGPLDPHTLRETSPLTAPTLHAAPRCQSPAHPPNPPPNASRPLPSPGPCRPVVSESPYAPPPLPPPPSTAALLRAAAPSPADHRPRHPPQEPGPPRRIGRDKREPASPARGAALSREGCGGRGGPALGMAGDGGRGPGGGAGDLAHGVEGEDELVEAADAADDGALKHARLLHQVRKLAPAAPQHHQLHQPDLRGHGPSRLSHG